jgi:DNA-binding NarL/FixJ family response regulator
VALVLADFMFGARVQAALARMGWTPRLAGTPAAVMEALNSAPPALLLVELGAGNPARIGLIRDVRARPEHAALPLLAFGSHKARAALQEARDAGATMVVSNGSLVSRFPELVRKAAGAGLTEEERWVMDDEE